MRVCSIEGCPRGHYSHDLCFTHSHRAKSGLPMDLPIQERSSPLWLDRLLEVGLKRCHQCRAVKPLAAFSARARLCRLCRAGENAGEGPKASRASYADSLNGILSTFLAHENQKTGKRQEIINNGYA